MTDGEEIKPGRVGEQLAQQLRRVREDRHVTYTELVKRLEELGHPIPILGLRRIERGERRVDVDDLIALARALRVPPVLLLFPVGAEGPLVQLVPGVLADPNAALAWFTGEGRMPHGLTDEEYGRQFGRGRQDPATGLYEWYDDPDVSWEADAAPVLLRRQHQRQIADWYAAVPLARRLASDEASFEQMVFKLRAAAEDSLRTLRAEMRRHGLTLPGLPGEIAERLDGRTEGSRAGGQTD
ncbi:helix-turn-helix domain-containing protein [Micromonospora coerulea]|uniref:helix-turn-helix domain-containing protein n=1 Tax=Micromonospora coerulea TaxID=47856 RepID=UPI0019061697|nr:helix-turn-helix transcriptional regulator [Micromonospora veneta]